MGISHFSIPAVVAQTSMLFLLSLLAVGLAMPLQERATAFDPLEHLAGIAPYFEPEDPPFDPNPPQGCKVSRAAYLVRHAAIFGNDFDFEEYIDPFLKKLENTTVNWSKTGALSFLANWKSPLKEADLEKLTFVGKEEARRLGQKTRKRYPQFRPMAKIWSSTAERTTESAGSFAAGYGDGPTGLVAVSEGKEEGANSLTPYKSCPAYSSSRGSEQSKVS